MQPIDIGIVSILSDAILYYNHSSIVIHNRPDSMSIGRIVTKPSDILTNIINALLIPSIQRL